MSFLSRLLSKKCVHYFSWPRSDGEGRYYQTCSRCGIAYEYDWNSMRRTDHRIVGNPAYSPTVAPVSHEQVAASLPAIR